ncbi:hypothetical protein ACSTD9_19225, partial [Vibrio vulnificus]|uniref:hypothetical protein n=1 Tax=Vibrio vulnificus TaxID=672 RepID=UPI003EDAA06F
ISISAFSSLPPASVLANNCQVAGYTVGFFNGVATTRTQAENGLLELKKYSCHPTISRSTG